ncbi:hypothetical protein SBOR_5522 [Sclerotinia borealis F-4128]|uniref:Uncharacterized protein n=1 Tax=Sclerotinia borealis (strain F-4128) TaxID=1432307 RepID=W9CBG7_SCLBF|nr:hypothetical protein SBOR_5522 [Sclerotinia borealis F-4128]
MSQELRRYEEKTPYQLPPDDGIEAEEYNGDERGQQADDDRGYQPQGGPGTAYAAAYSTTKIPASYGEAETASGYQGGHQRQRYQHYSRHDHPRDDAYYAHARRSSVPESRYGPPGVERPPAFERPRVTVRVGHESRHQTNHSSPSQQTIPYRYLEPGDPTRRILPHHLKNNSLQDRYLSRSSALHVQMPIDNRMFASRDTIPVWDYQAGGGIMPTPEELNREIDAMLAGGQENINIPRLVEYDEEIERERQRWEREEREREERERRRRRERRERERQEQKRERERHEAEQLKREDEIRRQRKKGHYAERSPRKHRN